MMIKKIGVAAVVVGMLTIPATAIADSAAVGATALVGPANQSALAQPVGLGPIATPLGACGTRVRWIAPLGAEGGHYVAACPQRLSSLPARGTEGGHYDYGADRCVQWVQPRGTEGGRYVGTCSPQPRWVPAHGTRAGHYESVGASPTRSSTKPIATAASRSEGTSWDFDWESAGIGAASIIGALAIALSALGGLRSRRIAGPHTS
jgi:hypothetical protein